MPSARPMTATAMPTVTTEIHKPEAPKSTMSIVALKSISTMLSIRSLS